MFKPVSSKLEMPALEQEMIELWRERSTMARYLPRNDASERRWSFIDGPITANNPMGVHHAWGRTYKDLYQRYNTMLGKQQRYQNGFDCQGLWVEVEVEKELGFKIKRDIEAYGIAKFVERCKERVQRFAARIRRAVDPPRLLDGLGQLLLHQRRTRTTTRSGHFLQDVPRARAGSTRATTSCPGARAAAPASPSRRSSPRATRS